MFRELGDFYSCHNHSAGSISNQTTPGKPAENIAAAYEKAATIYILHERFENMVTSHGDNVDRSSR